MTATLHADLVKEAREITWRKYSPENLQRDFDDACAVIRKLADAVESLERQLAEADEVGSTLYFDGEPYDQDPAYTEFAAKRDRMIARHRERMKEGE